MSYPSLTFAHLLENATRAELEQFVSLLQGYLSAQHDENGAHTVITATSVTATGAVTAGGAGMFGGVVTANSGKDLIPAWESALGEEGINASLVGPAVRLGKATNNLAWWIVADHVNPSPAQKRLCFIPIAESGTNRFALQLSNDAAGGSANYYLTGNGATSALNIGAPTSVFGAGFGVTVYGTVFGLGSWVAVTYAAGNFTASTGNWTVDSGDQVTYAYVLIGKTMTVAFEIETTDVSATPANLQIAIPASQVAAKSMRTLIQVIDAGGAAAVGVARVQATGTQILLQSTIGGGAWALTAADNTSVRGVMTFEVQ